MTVLRSFVYSGWWSPIMWIVVQLIGYVLLLLLIPILGNSVAFHYISHGSFICQANEPADSVFLGVNVEYSLRLDDYYRLICKSQRFVDGQSAQVSTSPSSSLSFYYRDNECSLIELYTTLDLVIRARK